MQPIAPISGSYGSLATDVRRRQGDEDTAPARDPPRNADPPPARGRPIQTVGFDPSLFQDTPEEPPPPATATEAPQDEPMDAAEVIKAGRTQPSASSVVTTGNPDPPPRGDPKGARLEIVDVHAHMGAPVAAFDPAQQPAKLVIYV